MLSQAIHTAALAHAAHLSTSQPSEAAQIALVDAYETGYGRGFRERPITARFPLAGDAAFKRLLGPYLAENITVYHPATGRYGLLRGLPACYEGQGEPLADVEFYADELAREDGGGDLLEPYGKILPVLYPPSALANPELAEKVGRLFREDFLGIQEIRSEDPEQAVAIYIDVPQGSGLVYYRKKDLEADSQQLLYRDAERLRSLHFAVGLKPHQYHRRVAGFDYASGGRPGCAGCERKEVCRG